MRKLVFMVLLFAQIIASTAFAYTNKEDGFKALSPSSDSYVEVVGRHFYGFLGNNGNAVCSVEMLMPEQADKFFGDSFTTAAFNKKYNDIMLLQRNGISQNEIKKILADLFISNWFEFKDGEEPDYQISACKFGRNKYIAVAFTIEDKPVTLYYTSANDRLYMLIAESGLIPDKKEADVIAVIGESDSAAAKNGNAANEAFLRKFKAFKPENDGQLFALTDKLSGYAVNLPDDWFYLQLKDSYNQESVYVSCAMPEAAARMVCESALDMGITDIDSAVNATESAVIADTGNDEALQNKKDQAFDIFRHGILLCSIKNGDEKWIGDLFKNPNQTVYEVKQYMEELKEYFTDQGAVIISYAYDAAIKDKTAGIYLQIELKP